MYKGEKIVVFKKLLSKIIVILFAVLLLYFGCNNNIYEDKNYHIKSDDVIEFDAGIGSSLVQEVIVKAKDWFKGKTTTDAADFVD